MLVFEVGYLGLVEEFVLGFGEVLDEPFLFDLGRFFEGLELAVLLG